MAVPLKDAVGFFVNNEDKVRGYNASLFIPFSGKVIFVPFFQTGLISIVRISSTVVSLLHKNRVINKKHNLILVRAITKNSVKILSRRNVAKRITFPVYLALSGYNPPNN